MPGFKLPQILSDFLWPPEYTPEELNEHAGALATFFPLLYYRKPHSNSRAIDALKSSYRRDPGYLEDLDEALLRETIFSFLQKLNRNGLSYINLEVMNREYAKKLSKLLIRAFEEENLERLDHWYNLPYIDSWFTQYEDKLRDYVFNRLPLINNKVWKYKAINLESMGDSSLAYIWKTFVWNNPVWNTQAVTEASKFLTKIADAHAFLQAASLSPQYESSILSFLDVYNYKRSYEQLNEIKSIAYSLLNPFRYIYYEYKNIAFYEKNTLWKFFRMLMPLLILVGSTILIASLITLVIAALVTPLALPELAFALACIPALFVGISISSHYIWLKNNIYNSVRSFVYGGQYKIPEFKVNTRMILTFGGLEKAKEVRDFYITQLKECDALEREYQKNENWLTSTEQTLRENNSKRRESLCLEWYDIHSSKMPIDKVPLLVQAQIRKTTLKETKELQTELETAEEEIELSLSQFTTDLKTTLIHCTAYEGEQAKKIPMSFTHRLFQPDKSLLHKINAEKMDTLDKSIESLLPSPDMIKF